LRLPRGGTFKPRPDKLLVSFAENLTRMKSRGKLLLL
jgi:hypothetical protein